MKPVINIRVRWGVRPMALDECATLVLRQLKQFGEVSSQLLAWQPTGPRATALELSDETQMQALLLSGRNRRDIDHTVIPELGYLISLRNVRTDLSAECTIQCGMHSAVASLSSRCLLKLNYSSAEKLTSVGIMQLMEGMICVLSPDQGEAFTLIEQGDRFEPLAFLKYVSIGNTATPDSGLTELKQTGCGVILKSDANFRALFPVQEL